MKKTKIKWLSKPQDHDYPAALSYLSLVMNRSAAKRLVAELEKAEVVEFAAKDIFRASGLSLLGASNSHVDKDRAKITVGESISPMLLIGGARGGHLTIADGYHRLCAAYTFDEDAMVPCKIIYADLDPHGHDHR